MSESFVMQSMDMKTAHRKQLEEILANMSLDWWPYTDLDTKFTIDPDGELFIRSSDITTPISVDRSATGNIKSFFCNGFCWV